MKALTKGRINGIMTMIRHKENKIKDKAERSKFRSKTFPGIAKAMAQQWGVFSTLSEQENKNG